MQPTRAISVVQSDVSSFTNYLRLLRPTQWVKNAFVLAPLLFSRSFLSAELTKRELLATLIFCLASSSAYVLNDLLDRHADALHPDKQRRPLASGGISTRSAIRLLLCLMAFVFVGLLWMPEIAPGVLCYLTLAISYSVRLKHWAWIDIVALAAAFVIRIQTGIMAIGAWPSPWMLSATAFLALYLAASKRREELLRVGIKARRGLQGYTTAQLDSAKLMAGMAAACSYAVFTATVRPALIPTVAFVILGIGRFEWWTRVNGSESAADAVLRDKWMAVLLMGWAAVALWALA